QPVLVLTGGEPLLREDIFDLARHGVKKGLTMALATNGTLVTPKIAQKILNAGFNRVAISLDGIDAQTHDTFRRVDGAFDAALAGIARLKAVGVSLQVNTTVTRHNAHQLEQMLDMVRSLKIAAWHLFLLVPVGCGLTIPEEQRVMGEEYETILRWFADRSATIRDLHLKATCAPQLFRIKLERKGGQEDDVSRMRQGCVAGMTICFISYRGEVQPCGFLPLPVGSIRKTSFKTIWQKAPLLTQLRDMDQLAGKCGECGYKDICGGCRARAYAATGDFLSEEPLCPYSPPLKQPPTPLS
ncbi:MAG: radical SAM protein, partial [bacterium]